MARGSLVKRGRRWSFVVPIRDENGKHKQRWYSGYPTRKAAQAALTDALSRLQSGTYSEPTKKTVAAFLRDDWLPSAEASVRPSTFAAYKILAEKHIIPALGGTPLQRLTAGQLDGFYNDLGANGRSNGKGGLSKRTVKHIHGVIRLALGHAVDLQLVPRNAALQAHPPKKEHAEMRVWSANEVRAFLDAMRDDRLYAAYALALTTGLRRGELLGLAWRDVDLDAGRVQVRQTVISVNFKIERSKPKTDAGRRSVTLDPGTVEVLRSHRSRQLEERFSLGLGRPSADDFLFAGLDGEPLHPSLFSDAFDRRVKASGLPRIRFHDLRHTSATLALAAGVHPKVVQERLGHSSVAITLDLYSHSVPAMQTDAAAKIGGLVFAAGSAR